MKKIFPRGSGPIVTEQPELNAIRWVSWPFRLRLIMAYRRLAPWKIFRSAR